MSLKKRSFTISLSIAIVLVVAALYYQFIYVPGKNAPPTPAMLQSWQYPVEQITTNLQNGSVIQAQFTLQAPDAAVNTELQSMTSQVEDSIIGVLHNLSSNDIMQRGGQTTLKELIAHNVSRLLPSGKITTVYINSLIVQ